MSNPYVGEIRIFAGSFAPAGWMTCEGQLLPISENETLFNLIGTMYGGDGQSTFGLPDLRGRTPVHQGNGGIMGEEAGVESVTLTTQQIPVHTHAVTVTTDQGTQLLPTDEMLGSNPTVLLFRPGNAVAPFDPSAMSPVGGSQPHTNMQPDLVMTYIISLFGLYPNQN